MFQGVWQLRTLAGPVDLYTRRWADIIVDTHTGMEYIRGERIVIRNAEDMPKLVEDDPNFQFTYLQKQSATEDISSKDFLKEIFANSLLK